MAMTQAEIAEALCDKELGPRQRCTWCGEDVWWDHGMWRSIRDAGQCYGPLTGVERPGGHHVSLPDPSSPVAIERWLADA